MALTHGNVIFDIVEAFFVQFFYMYFATHCIFETPHNEMKEEKKKKIELKKEEFLSWMYGRTDGNQRCSKRSSQT